ncbi:MAG: hypothetical protein Q4F71_01505, partial [Paracoccus sp. (in: a-proteobacteria)]|nr:hypothetical protein [Paracoccus sp. (in: a-proteobacteria)]
MTVPFRFDGDWYKKTYPDVEQSGLDPLIHYQRYGALMGRLSAPDAPPTDDWRSPICTPTYLRMFSEVSGSLEAWAKRMRSRESRRLFAYGMSNGSMPLEFLESVLEAL